MTSANVVTTGGQEAPIKALLLPTSELKKKGRQVVGGGGALGFPKTSGTVLPYGVRHPVFHIYGVGLSSAYATKAFQRQ